jgi:hypothetical protein
MAAHLLKAAVVDPLTADQDRLDRRLHIIVDPACAGAFEESEGAVMRVQNHLQRLARIGAHEHHPAMTQPNVRHLHRHRRAVDQHDLVAPVELVGLAGCEAQGHICVYRRRGLVTLPAAGVAADGVVAAFVTPSAEILEDPDQRQAFAPGLAIIGSKQTVEVRLPRADPGKRLRPAFVVELRRLRPQNLAHDLPRDPQLPADLLDRLLLNEICAPDLGDSLHYQHPNPGPRSSRKPA